MISKRVILILFNVLLPLIFAEAQTQLETYIEAQNELELSDQKMDSVFTAILKKHKDAPEFIANLKKAQEAWINFRDAHLESMYPGKNKRAKYGTVYPVCASNFLAHLHNQRTEQLKLWLKGTVEGDVCTGSVKLTSQLE